MWIFKNKSIFFQSFPNIFKTVFNFTKFSSKKKENGKISVVKMSKKGDFENPKVPNYYFSTKSVFNYCGFSKSAVC